MPKKENMKNTVFKIFGVRMKSTAKSSIITE